MKDVIIIGAGPAGMTAAIYAHGAGLSVALVERAVCGGQMAVSSLIDNYPGLGTVRGSELSEKMLKQVEATGICITYADVRGIERDGDLFRVIVGDGAICGYSVILATGVKRREAGFAGERELIGKGVSYCAVCDGAFFRDRDVCVVGGGNSAVEEALYLSELCRRVYVVHRREKFRADEKYTLALERKANIIPYMGYVPIRAIGKEAVSGLEIESEGGGNREVLQVRGVFVAVGLVPDNVRFADTVPLTRDGYFITDGECRTSVDGIFACGDGRQKRHRQITTAVADGTVAATLCAEYVRDVKASRSSAAVL